MQSAMGGHSGDLCEYLDRALKQSNFPGRPKSYFASKKMLQDITHLNIAQTIDGDANKVLVDFISSHAPELFAICICSGITPEGLVPAIKHLMIHGISDRSLPISKPRITSIWPKEWAMRIRHFQNFQYTFRAQSFPKKDKFEVVDLPEDIILPITDARQIECQGQFGIVYRAKIDPDHLDPDDPIRKVKDPQAALV